MLMNRIVEYVFFFGFMAIVAYILWEMLAPFVSALALSAIIVTISYPLYERILKHVPRKNKSAAALVTTLLVLLIVIFPLFFIASSLVNEALSMYSEANNGGLGFVQTLNGAQVRLEKFVPGFEINMTEYVKQASAWLAGNIGAIFAGTASTVFLFFIALVGSFYLFRDGKEFTKKLIVISPLPDTEDELILQRMAVAVRSVATGTVFVALIQGTLTAIGLAVTGFDKFMLLGTVAALGALIPGVGTSIVLIPSILYLFFTGSYVTGVVLLLWGVLAVGLIDNLLGPYLMSRGNPLHPFVVLLSVLGGIAFFGPIGFIVGPVVVSLFVVLLELYTIHISEKQEEDK